MDVFNVLKDVGLGLLSATPLGKLALPVINAFLPDDKQLTDSSTGIDAKQAIATLSPELQQQLSLAKITQEVEEDKGRTSRYEAMCAADGQETRAKLVNKAMNCLILLSLIFVAAVAYVYSTKGADAAFSYEMGFCFITVSGTFAYVVRAYMGDLKTETTSRHNVINDTPPPTTGLAGVINAIKGR
ncbi:hypothetical protein [Colwellia psychrerythraea]|uniref:Uncharacterized protein n=1 Tax=Colwellia psychrerythraea TaxID=28229 RepID=A0A099KNX3_COLPS|nr:hypothetical protein [Colwellia psychrerythraea]KGJ92156.1 hypothetical protein ND2E_3049 [Colwellia psychrerythraea]